MSEREQLMRNLGQEVHQMHQHKYQQGHTSCFICGEELLCFEESAAIQLRDKYHAIAQAQYNNKEVKKIEPPANPTITFGKYQLSTIGDQLVISTADEQGSFSCVVSDLEPVIDKAKRLPKILEAVQLFDKAMNGEGDYRLFNTDFSFKTLMDNHIRSFVQFYNKHFCSDIEVSEMEPFLDQD